MPLFNPSGGVSQAALDAVEDAIPVKASGAEVDTGTDDAKFVTAQALTDSDYIKEVDLPEGGGGIPNSATAPDITVQTAFFFRAGNAVAGGMQIEVNADSDWVSIGAGSQSGNDVSNGLLVNSEGGGRQTDLGDISQLGNFTRLRVDDLNSFIQAQSKGQVRLGDYDSDANHTILVINDVAQTIVLDAVNGIELISAVVKLTGLPTSNPGVNDVLWSDNGTLKLGSEV